MMIGTSPLRASLRLIATSPRQLTRALLLALLGLHSCASYSPQPLPGIVASAADAPSLPERLSASAQSLHHALLPTLEVDLRDGLSPDEMAIAAVLLNPHLQVLRAQHFLADAQLLQAGLLPNPDLSVGLERPSFGATGGTVNGVGVGLNWAISDVIGRRQRQAASLADKERIDLEVAWQEWQVAQAARALSWQAVLLAQEIPIAQEVLKRAGDRLQLVTRAVGSGFLPRQELVAASSAVESFSRQRDRLIQEQAAVLLALGAYLGADINETILIQIDLQLPLAKGLPARAELLLHVADARLDLLALEAGYEAEEERFHAAVLQQFPRLSFGMSRNRDTGDVGTIGLGVSLSLPLFDRGQGAIASAEATRDLLRMEIEARRLQARTEIVDGEQRFFGSLRQLHAGELFLNSLKDQLRLATAARKEGLITVLNYLDQEEALDLQHLEVLRLRRDLLFDAINLEMASGQFGILLTPVPTSRS